MLTNPQILNAKPREKPYRLSDALGLYIEVAPSGGRYWRFKYRFASKEKRLALGTYPEVTLKDARGKRDDARRALREGSDPAEDRKASKAAKRDSAVSNSRTFEVVARDWFAKRSPKWAATYSGRLMARLERDLFPRLGSRPIAELTAADFLAELQLIADRGAHETAHRARRDCSEILSYADLPAIADELARKSEELPDPVERHHAAITDPIKAGDLLRTLDGYQGRFDTRCGLRLAPLVFVRPGELRHAEWSEINLDAAEWRIPAAKMKRRVAHLVPLSWQAVAIFTQMQPLTGTGRYVFPSVRSPARPMSNNTLNAALRRLGYSKEEMTAHGFRTLASTLFNERGYSRDAIERQLAHMERDNVRAAYNRAEYLPERRRMMQEWADYLDTLRAGTDNVVPIRRTA